MSVFNFFFHDIWAPSLSMLRQEQARWPLLQTVPTAAASGAKADAELELSAGTVAQGLGGGAAADGQRASCCLPPRRIVVTDSQASPAQ